MSLFLAVRLMQLFNKKIVALLTVKILKEKKTKKNANQLLSDRRFYILWQFRQGSNLWPID